uniref:Sodium-coupled monocarboxylate transporter 1-like n=1 Tax=Phascolarctos cinereus TaxID=38626 RepID=A0A6P5JYR7_PHACI|nr:sodium-coupled monocarboxylate transporter 1-like [Phascolarctos cinereus]
MSDTFSAWDYAVFLGLLLVSAALGVYYAFVDGGQSTEADFLMARRGLTAAPVSLSLAASFMSAVTVLGTPAEVYRFGAAFLLLGVAYALVVIVASEIYMPVFYRLGVTSTHEVGGATRLVVRLLCAELQGLKALSLEAPPEVRYMVSVMDKLLHCSSGLVFVISGSHDGLVPRVVWFLSWVGQSTDELGRALAVCLEPTGDAYAVQGSGTLPGAVLSFNPSPLQRHTFWTIAIGGTFTWTGIYGVNQSQVQRYLACKTRFQAKLALYLSLLGLWVILVCAVLSGLGLYSMYRNCDPWTSHKVSAPDQLMSYLAVEILSDSPGLPGLFVACAYSGTLSTVSSSISALAAVTVEDLIKPHLSSPSQKTLSLFSKGTSLFYGILCIGMAALASLMGGLLQAALSIFGMIGGPLLGLFTLGILNPFANSLGSFIGLIAGFTVSMWIGVGAHFYPPPLERTLPLPLSVANCTVTRNTHLDWTKFPEHPFLRPWKTSDLKRTSVMDNLYSISYLYLSALGTLITVFVGTVFSLLTGGKEQHIDRKYLLNIKEDMTLGSFKKEHCVAVPCILQLPQGPLSHQVNRVEVSAPQN